MILASGAELKMSEAGNDGWHYPPNNVDWSEYSEVQFAILVQSLGGSPTKATLKAQFEFLMPHAGDEGEEGYRYAKRLWTPISEPLALGASGRKTVTTAGTVVALTAEEIRCDWVTVTALATNTALVAVGAKGVKAHSGEEAGTLLQPGQSATFSIKALAELLVDAQVSGQGVSYTYGSDSLSHHIVGGHQWNGTNHVPPVLATQADGLPLAPVYRTINSFGQAVRVGFTPECEGGTTPYWKVIMTACGKG